MCFPNICFLVLVVLLVFCSIPRTVLAEKDEDIMEMRGQLTIGKEYDSCSTDPCDQYRSLLCKRIAETSSYTVFRSGNAAYPGCHCCWRGDVTPKLRRHLEKQAKAYWREHYQLSAIHGFTCMDMECISLGAKICSIAALEESSELVKVVVNPFDGNHCRCCNKTISAKASIEKVWLIAEKKAKQRDPNQSASLQN